MHRRKALKNIGAGISAGLTLPLWLSACKESEIGPQITYDGVVAVIGAGAAGLYAADSLKTKGITVKVFEASDRIGGRIRSVTLADNSAIETDFPIELGAERILGSDAIWARFVNELGIPLTQADVESNNGFIINDSFATEASLQAEADFIASKNFYNNISSQTITNTSVAQALEASGIHSRMFPMLNSLIGNKYGTSNSRLEMSAVAARLQQQNRNSEEYMVRANPMYNVLFSRFSNIIPNVELNSIVKNIDYGSDKILISGERKSANGSTENFSEQVDKVILTVPVSIIKNGAIKFTPELPSEKINALSSIGMDASIRVVLDFKQNFWGDNLSFIYGGETAPEYFSAGLNRSEFNKTLSITINGPAAEVLSAKNSETEMVLEILHELDEAFDGKASLNIRKDEADQPLFMIKDWSKEPFIQGGTSYLKVGGSVQDRIQYAALLSGKLYFAGEATDITDPGTINGALLSAERVVTEVVNSIMA